METVCPRRQERSVSTSRFGRVTAGFSFKPLQNCAHVFRDEQLGVRGGSFLRYCSKWVIYYRVPGSFLVYGGSQVKGSNRSLLFIL